MKTKLLIALILLTSNTFWSCQDVVLIDRMEELEAVETEMIQEEMSLKSAPGTPICTPKYIPLLAGQNLNVGNLKISNTNEVLKVKFVNDPYYSVSSAHLWVGTEISQVPMNKNDIPVPGKFPYKDTGDNNFSFEIPLSDIDNPEELLNNKPVYLFAHAIITNIKTGETESVWSAGETFGSQRWGMYSVYHCCIPDDIPGTRCDPYVANCGSKIDNVFFYDNRKGGDQIIMAENGEVAGTVIYKNGKFYFNFTQDWMFTDLLSDPILVIHGCYKPNTTETELFSGDPESNQGPDTASVSYYPYYKLELKVQYCR